MSDKEKDREKEKEKDKDKFLKKRAAVMDLPNSVKGINVTAAAASSPPALAILPSANNNASGDNTNASTSAQIARGGALTRSTDSLEDSDDEQTRKSRSDTSSKSANDTNPSVGNSHNIISHNHTPDGGSVRKTSGPNEDKSATSSTSFVVATNATVAVTVGNPRPKKRDPNTSPLTQSKTSGLQADGKPTDERAKGLGYTKGPTTSGYSFGPLEAPNQSHTSPKEKEKGSASTQSVLKGIIQKFKTQVSKKQQNIQDLKALSTYSRSPVRTFS